VKKNKIGIWKIIGAVLMAYIVLELVAWITLGKGFGEILAGESSSVMDAVAGVIGSMSIGLFLLVVFIGIIAVSSVISIVVLYELGYRGRGVRK
jgi:hypothetical protein